MLQLEATFWPSTSGAVASLAHVRRRVSQRGSELAYDLHWLAREDWPAILVQTSPSRHVDVSLSCTGMSARMADVGTAASATLAFAAIAWIGEALELAATVVPAETIQMGQ